MEWVITVVVLLLVSGLASMAIGPFSKRGAFLVGIVGASAAAVMGMIFSLFRTVNGTVVPSVGIGATPLGELRIGLDPLSSFFLLCIALVSGLSSLYSLGYLRHERDRVSTPFALFCFNLLTGSMIVVVTARDAVSFLLGWEVMTLSSFFLVTRDHHRPEVRRAGFLYLAASQAGVLFVFLLFGLLWRETGNYRFDAFESVRFTAVWIPSLAFLFALIGFGTKAGFWGFHIWLPEAHPAAPSHVSALMSGVMVKLGIYGILRTLTFLGAPPPWWGMTLLMVGIVSGVAGVIQALGNHDLKRMLAYSSIENVGVIAIGIGVGLLGWSYKDPSVAFLGIGGALLHVFNHGLFKGLLFHGAGSVVAATGVRNSEVLGGLYKKMPVTGSTFLVGSIAISGLPPLNGFISEWLIYVGLFQGVLRLQGPAAGVSVVGIVSLALIGGLAAASFAKVFSVVFLGEPRSRLPRAVEDGDGAMRLAMVVGALLCLGGGLWPEGGVALISNPVRVVAVSGAIPHEIPTALSWVGWSAFLLFGLVGAGAYARQRLFRGRTIGEEPTWGCGYDLPSARMQYTASSFAAPLLGSLGPVIRKERRGTIPRGFFPASAHLSEHVIDRSLDAFWIPSVRRTIALFRRLKFLQQGRLQWYLLYILLTLIVLLLWKVR